jgi:hypothetical protein
MCREPHPPAKWDEFVVWSRARPSGAALLTQALQGVCTSPGALPAVARLLRAGADPVAGGAAPWCAAAAACAADRPLLLELLLRHADKAVNVRPWATEAAQRGRWRVLLVLLAFADRAGAGRVRLDCATCGDAVCATVLGARAQPAAHVAALALQVEAGRHELTDELRAALAVVSHVPEECVGTLPSLARLPYQAANSTLFHPEWNKRVAACIAGCAAAGVPEELALATAAFFVDRGELH